MKVAIKELLKSDKDVVWTKCHWIMLAWLIKSFLAVSSSIRLVNTQLACQNQIKVFTVFRLAKIFAQNLHKLKPGRIVRSISLLSWNAIFSSSIDWKLFGPFIDVLHVESAVQTFKRGTKGNPIFRILCWNYTIVVQNTNIITHATHYVHDEECKRMR